MFVGIWIGVGVLAFGVGYYFFLEWWHAAKRSREEEEGVRRKRRGIGGFGRVFMSKRFAGGKLGVVRVVCPWCGHGKAFEIKGRMKCTRCKREFA